MPISRHIAQCLRQGSWIRRLFEEGVALRADGTGRPVYDFSLGNPDVDPPEAFTAALQQLAQDTTPGRHGYMPNSGHQHTRQALAQSLAGDYALPFGADDIVMTVGAAGALNAAFKAILDPGEEVIVPAPHFVEYRFYVDNHGGALRVIPPAPGFRLDVPGIEAAITERTRAVLITNPNNPTGVMYAQDELDALGDVLRRHSAGRERPIFLIDDAPYRRLVFDVPQCTSAFAAYENTLMGTSFSKDLGLPGERIGFLAISPRLVGRAQLAAACAFTNRTLGYVNAPALMQRAIAQVPDAVVDLTRYRQRRDRLYGALTDMGYRVVKPDGAFYMFPEAPGGDDIAFVEALRAQRVLVVPGSGVGAPGFFRIAYCVPEDTIEGALPAFAAALSSPGQPQ